MEAHEERTMRIARQLAALTSAGKIEWVKTIRGRYVFSSGSASATISEGALGSYVFSVQNEDGDTVDRIDSSEVPQLGPTLEQLFAQAEHQALRVDETLDRFLKDLGA